MFVAPRWQKRPVSPFDTAASHPQTETSVSGGIRDPRERLETANVWDACLISPCTVLVWEPSAIWETGGSREMLIECGWATSCT
jgi:hypothetical protein